MGIVEAKEEFLRWYQMNAKERRNALLPRTIAAFATAFQVNLNTVKGWRRELNKKNSPSGFDVCPVCDGKGKIQAGSLDTDNLRTLLRHFLIKLCHKSPQAAKVLAEIEGIYTQKIDIKQEVSFGPDSHIEIARRFTELLREASNRYCGRDCPLLSQPSLLCEPLRLHPGQDLPEENQVATLAVSPEDAG